MKKPNFVHCSDCENFYWYASKCIAYSEPSEEEECDYTTFVPETISWCDKFELKHTQEHGFEFYDPLPDVETVEKVKELYIKMCDDIISKQSRVEK